MPIAICEILERNYGGEDDSNPRPLALPVKRFLISPKFSNQLHFWKMMFKLIIIATNTFWQLFGNYNFWRLNFNTEEHKIKQFLRYISI